MTGVGLVLCQNPAYRRGESDEPGCQDKIVKASREWVDNKGQQELGEFLDC